MDGEVLLEARNLSRSYGPTKAVSDLNFTLKKGEILGLLGPNGAGKSTTMNMLAGCLSPSAGTVLINGISMQEQPEAAKAHLGYLPEKPPVYPELNVDEYLMFCAGLHGIPRADRKAALARAKQACGLNEMSRRNIANLSKGFQQRVGLAQAIIHRPPVVILDEPTVGLDPIQIREIRALIAELSQEHSVILSSHILPEIQAVCSRVMVIANGRMAYSASMDEAAKESASKLFFRTRADVAIEEIQAIAGTGEVSRLKAGEYSLQCAEGADPRDQLVRVSVEKNWGLLELRASVSSLEERFVDLVVSGSRTAEAA